MTKFIARTGIFAAQAAVMLSQYWFTFGLWPKSWVSFVLCAVASLTLLAFSIAIDKEAV